MDSKSSLSSSSWGIKKKQIVVFLMLGVVTALITGGVGYWNARNALETESFNKLTAVREIKGSQIENYFQQIEHQVVTFSEDRMIIDATKAFRAAFQAVEGELNQTDLSQVDLKNRQYYETEFFPKLKRNTDRSISENNYFPSEKTTRILQNLYFASNPHPTGEKDNLDNAGDGSSYSQIHETYHPIIRSYLKKFGYYDIFIVDPDTGHIVYSVFKEVDYATSLLSGPYQNTNFAEAFRATRNARDKDFVKLVDFQPYDPSYHAAASFIASPIFEADQLIGVLVFQMPIDEINGVMTSNQQWIETGLGASGETYLVGNDSKLRSQSRFLIEGPENYFEALEKSGLSNSVIDQIRNQGTAIGLQPVQTEGTSAAVAGKSGQAIFPDYRNVSVLSSYRPLKIAGVDWIIMSEIDEAEALAAATSLMWQILVVIGFLIAVCFVLAYSFASRFTAPIIEMMRMITEISKGHLSFRVTVTTHDEIGRMVAMMNEFAHSLELDTIAALQKVAKGDLNVNFQPKDEKDVIGHAVVELIDNLNITLRKVQNAAGEVAQQSQQILLSSQELSQMASSQASALEKSSASIQEVAAQAKQNDKNAQEAKTLSMTSKNSSEESNQKMSEMVKAMQTITQTSDDISKIIKTIDEIAFQTNLLAINAAVEAARAGQYGVGFAVVADEVRSLAQSSANAARQTTDLIANSNQRVQEGMQIASDTADSLMEVMRYINQVTETVNEITNASQQQAVGVEQINVGLTQIEKVTQNNASSAKQTTQSAEILAQQSQDLREIVGQFQLRVDPPSQPSTHVPLQIGQLVQ